jgi:hypothetical protein
LLVPAAVSFVLILCALGCVVYSSFWWESSLFPALRKIDPLQRDLTILQAKVDQLDQTVHGITERGAEIDALKNQITTLQQTLATLGKESVKSSETQTQPEDERNDSLVSQEVKEAWEKLRTQLQQGEVCTDLFTEFKTKLSSKTSLDKPLQRIEEFSQKPAKSMVFLQNQLNEIYQIVKTSDLADEKVTIPESQGWWAVAWKFLSQWIHIRPLENKDKLISVTTAFEKALQALKNNQLDQTIAYLKNLPSIETVNEWLTQAEQRQLCDRIISDVDKFLVQIVKG